MSFEKYIEQKKRIRIITKTKEAMKKKGIISEAALYAANAYVQKTYGIVI